MLLLLLRAVVFMPHEKWFVRKYGSLIFLDIGKFRIL
jgi:hypothetical protein